MFIIDCVTLLVVDCLVIDYLGFVVLMFPIALSSRGWVFGFIVWLVVDLLLVYFVLFCGIVVFMVCLFMI